MPNLSYTINRMPHSFGLKWNLITIKQFLKLIIKLIFLNSQKIILPHLLCTYIKLVKISSQEETEKSIAFKYGIFLCFRIWKPDLGSS